MQGRHLTSAEQKSHRRRFHRHTTHLDRGSISTRIGTGVGARVRVDLIAVVASSPGSASVATARVGTIGPTLSARLVAVRIALIAVFVTQPDAVATAGDLTGGAVVIGRRLPSSQAATVLATFPPPASSGGRSRLPLEVAIVAGLGRVDLPVAALEGRGRTGSDYRR